MGMQRSWKIGSGETNVLEQASVVRGERDRGRQLVDVLTQRSGVDIVETPCVDLGLEL